MYVCVCLSNYTLMNKVLCQTGVPHSSGFKPEEQTATASLHRPTGTEQNTNVNRRLGEESDEGSAGQKRKLV